MVRFREMIRVNAHGAFTRKDVVFSRCARYEHPDRKRRNEMTEIIREIESAQLKDGIADFRVGDTVRVHGKIKEGNRERIQIFEGIVMKRQGGSNRATFTVRKISSGIGVEKTWPLHSPNVARIELVRHGKVRRAKLNYLRERTGKRARVKEIIK